MTTGLQAPGDMAVVSRPRAMRWRLATLVCANFLSAVGGGQLLSASEAAMRPAPLGGSITALLVGSAVGLGLVTLAPRAPHGQMLIGLTLAAMLSSSGLLVLVGLNNAALSHLATGALIAWLFFAGLVARTAVLFAGRSLRSAEASKARVSWLAPMESAYFTGLIVGLLIGSVIVGRSNTLASSLALDLLLVAIALASDLVWIRAGLYGRDLPERSGTVANRAVGWTKFWRLTAAFCAAVVACQVVVFHVAETLGRESSTAGAWASEIIGGFYSGVAVAAACCFRLRPTLERRASWVPGVVMRTSERSIYFPLIPLVILTGILQVTGLLEFAGIAGAARGASPWSVRGILAFMSLMAGSCLFEVLTLAILGAVSSETDNQVALAIGVGAATAAIALIVLMLSPLQLSGSLMVLVVGLGVTVLLLTSERAFWQCER